MAEQKNQPDEGDKKDTTNDDDTPVGAGNQDTQVAEAAGITEGDVKALRDDAGIDLMAGSEANVLAWEASVEGQAFIKDAESKEAKTAAKDEEKALKESYEENQKPVEAYKKAVEKGRKANS